MTNNSGIEKTIQPIFSPAISVLNRMGYTRKFTLLWLMSLVAIAVVTYSLFSSLDRVIQPSQRELQGLLLIEPVFRTVQVIQLHRGLSTALLGGNETIRERRAAKGREAAEVFNAMEGKLPPRLTSGENFLRIKADWEKLRKEGPHWTADENFAAHTRLIEQLQSFEASVVDDYALILDAELDTYYLIDTNVNKLPHVLEYLGQLRAYGTGILARKQITERQQIKLNNLIALLDSALNELSINIEKTGRYSPTVRKSLLAAYDGIADLARQITDLVASDILAGHFATPPDVFLDMATAEIDKGYAQMYQALLPTTKALIEKRIARAENTLLMTVSSALLLFLLAVYFSVAMYYAIVGSIRSLVRSAHTFAEGDLGVRVKLNTRDELSRIGDSFNKMADGFSALLEARTQAVHDLYESEKLYHSLFENMLNGFAYCQMLFEQGQPQDFIFISVNAAFEAQTGLKNAVGKRVSEVVPGIRQSDPELFEALGRVSLSGKPERLEIYLNVMQQWFWMSVYSPENGYFVVVFDVVTERKRAEEDLRKSKDLLLSVVENAPVRIFWKDRDSRYLGCNTHFAKDAGYFSPDELTGKTDFDMGWKDQAKLYRADDEEVMNSGNAKLDYEEPQTTPDGNMIWLRTSKVPLRDKSNQVVGILGIYEDITERKRMETELLQLNSELEEKVLARTADLNQALLEADQANRAKSDFLSTMSHEIRTPMNGVIGMIDVLQQSSLNGTQMEMANIIHDSAFALLAIIDDILDFSKIEAGKLQIDYSPMDVAGTVEGVCETLTPLALEKGVELTLFTDPNIPSQVMGNAGRLRQILVNLANNAIKFSSGQARQGKVSVRAVLAESTPEQVTLEFRVADNGIGMDAATQARLFAPFTQADSTTTRIYGGTGLGLAISRQLANIMGGTIAVLSEPGEGSMFSVRLPFKLLPDGGRDLTRQDELAGLKPDLLAGLPCLVADGSGSMADDLAAYLEHAGAVVERAEGLAAIQQWIAGRPPGLCVVVIHTEGVHPLLDELRAAARARPNLDVRFVAIKRGGRRQCRVVAADLVCLDAEVMHRRAFLDAVAIAAGRAKQSAPEDKHGDVKAKSALSREDARRQGSLILVAEDNEINQKVIRQQFMLLGQTADIANNGREALERWLSGDYAILFTDLHMPAMDGYELTAAIRAAEKADSGKTRIPIIAFTANALKGEAERCIAIGMDDYLSKPVQLVNLKAMLEKWLPVAAAGHTPDLAAPSALPVHDGLTITERFVHTLETKAPPRSAGELAQEFQIQQIELKMQNEELRLAQIALEESRDRYLELYESSPIGYLTLTGSGQIAEANLTSATLFRMERTKLLHRRFDRFVAPEYRDHWHRLFMSMMKHAGAAINLALQRGDGSRFNAHLDCRREETGQAKPVLHIAITDLSERELDGAAMSAALTETISTPRSSFAPDQSLPLSGGGNIVLDVNVLKALIGDDDPMIREFLHDFRISAAKIAEELRTACAAGQAAAAGALAHKLKSSSRSVGALALGELCAAMEQAGRAGDAEALVVLLPKFEMELASVERFLDGY